MNSAPAWCIAWTRILPGLILIAKDDRTLSWLQDQFRLRQVT